MECVQVKPGDVIILHHPGSMSDTQQEALRKKVNAVFPDNKVLVLESGMVFAVAHNVSEG